MGVEILMILVGIYLLMNLSILVVKLDIVIST